MRWAFALPFARGWRYALPDGKQSRRDRAGGGADEVIEVVSVFFQHSECAHISNSFHATALHHEDVRAKRLLPGPPRRVDCRMRTGIYISFRNRFRRQSRFEDWVFFIAGVRDVIGSWRRLYLRDGGRVYWGPESRQQILNLELAIRANPWPDLFEERNDGLFARRGLAEFVQQPY